MNERNRQEDKWEKIVELCEEGHYLSEEELNSGATTLKHSMYAKNYCVAKTLWHVGSRNVLPIPKLNGNGFTHGRKMQLPPKRRLLHVSRRITVFYGESRRAWRLRF